MQERFSDSSRSLMAHAREEAQRLGHDYLGTEHLLLGLLRTRPSDAVDLLESHALDPAIVRAEVERRLIPGHGAGVTKLPFTPRARRVLEEAAREATARGEPRIGTAEVLTALLLVGEGVAGRVLGDLGLTVEAVREKIDERRAVEDAMGRGDAGAADLAELERRLRACERELDDLRALARRLAEGAGEAPGPGVTG